MDDDFDTGMNSKKGVSSFMMAVIPRSNFQIKIQAKNNHSFMIKLRDPSYKGSK